MTEQTPHTPDSSDPNSLAPPGNIGKIFWSLIVLSALVFLADALYHKHPSFGIEKLFGFYGIIGFVACIGLILAAKGLRVILMRSEDYYDDKTEGDS